MSEEKNMKGGAFAPPFLYFNAVDILFLEEEQKSKCQVPKGFKKRGIKQLSFQMKQRIVERVNEKES